MVSIWCFSPGIAPLFRTNRMPERAVTSSKAMVPAGGADASDMRLTGNSAQIKVSRATSVELLPIRRVFAHGDDLIDIQITEDLAGTAWPADFQRIDFGFLPEPKVL